MMEGKILLEEHFSAELNNSHWKSIVRSARPEELSTFTVFPSNYDSAESGCPGEQSEGPAKSERSHYVLGKCISF